MPAYRTVHHRDMPVSDAMPRLRTSFDIHSLFAPEDGKHVYITRYPATEGLAKYHVDAVIEEGEEPPW